jgi:hypothetical protein
MNVWCRYDLVWDLARYKWEIPEQKLLQYGNEGMWLKCNGKHLIGHEIFTNKCYKLDLAGSEYFPYSS